ncbi:MAG: endonuclease III [Gemmataceae bacterium]|nr:endonuclease III [Gemmataceae bacterium]
MKPRELKQQRVDAIVARLDKQYPDATCALTHRNAIELLVATILSAQCTDVRVNLVTPALFKKYSNAKAFADADPAELERMIQSTGFFRNKTKSIQSACRDIVEKHGGEVPRTMEELTPLAGVGRKTANVILGNAFDTPGITVDTHVGRLSRRMAFTKHADPVKVEQDLMKLIPGAQWTNFSHRMIYHGRQICRARNPQCESCILIDLCPKVGVVPPATKDVKAKPKKKGK